MHVSRRILSAAVLLAGCGTTEPEAEPLPAADPRVLVGRVVSTADSTPIVGATIVASYWTGAWFGSPTAVVGTSSSGSDGRFRMTLWNPPAGNVHDCGRTLLQASHSQFVAAAVGSCPEGPADSVIVIRMAPNTPSP